MTVLLASKSFFERHGADIDRINALGGPRGPVERIEIPEEDGARLANEDMERLTVAFSSGDLMDNPALGLRRKLYGSARRAPKLEWLHASNVGTDDPIFAELMDKGIAVSNSPGASAEPIALTMLAGMLSLARQLPYHAANQQDHRWGGADDEDAPPRARPDDLRGQTVTIVGLGAIGGFFASFLRPTGMHIIGVRRTPAGPAEGVDEWVSPDRLAEVLPRTQWLALAAPLTAQTRGMIDAKALALLPQGAHVLNVGRGQLIDEDALIAALQSGHLGGAYLDVFNEEPLPTESPLWDIPNVILTPHASNSSTGNTERADAMFIEELERWQRGEQPTRVVTER